MDAVHGLRHHDRRRSGIRAALADGLRTPAGAHPHPLKHTSYWPSEAERRRQAELQKHRDARSAELNLDPTIIASRATLAELAQERDRQARTVDSLRAIKDQLEARDAGERREACGGGGGETSSRISNATS